LKKILGTGRRISNLESKNMNKLAMLLRISVSAIIIVPVSTAEVGSIQGYNINDQNSNGLWDAGEMGIPGWNITLISQNSETITTNTNASGFYKFEGLAAGTYIVSEDVQEGWINTGEPVMIINLSKGEISKNNNFANILVEPINTLMPAQSITTPVTTSNIIQTIAAPTKKVAGIPAWNGYIALAVILAVYFFVITKREEKK
jgi:SdrD B-like domain